MTVERCPGTLSRRSFIRLGLGGFASLGLADLFRLQAATPARRDTSVIVLWLWGGPSHMETFDLKPDAPAEYRGEFKPIATSIPGLFISEHLPRLARIAHRFALIRSLSHGSTGHVNSTHTMLTGYPGEVVESPPFQPKYPDAWAVANHVLGQRRRGMPAYFAMPHTRYNGAGYLGGGLDPLVISSDPNWEGFRPPNLVVDEALRPRIGGRMDLLRQMDTLNRRRETDALDLYQQKAADVLTSNALGKAFDLEREPARVRERYGRHETGQRLLLARRLVEAGARLVTVDFPCVRGQKAFSWDDHASVWNIFEQMKIRLPVLDQMVSALIDDLHERGLDRDVLFLVMGEMSHTPKLSNHQGQPGREHWAQTMSLLLSGGGMRMGQAIGATNRTGDEVRDRGLSPNDLLATIYQHLGVPRELHFRDQSGRPVPLLPQGEPIRELWG